MRGFREWTRSQACRIIQLRDMIASGISTGIAAMEYVKESASRYQGG